MSREGFCSIVLTRQIRNSEFLTVFVTSTTLLEEYYIKFV
jgi:hypothetical protein